MYEYTADVVRVIDGDTVVLRVDCGFRLAREDSFRLARINAPELHGVDGAGSTAKAYLEWLLGQANCNFMAAPGYGDPAPVRVMVRTQKGPDKYGRYLVDIFAPDNWCVNDEMVAQGHAVYYMGGPL